MKTKIERYLERKGFQKLVVGVPDLSVFFTIEKSYINAFVLADADGEPGVTAELLNNFLEKSDWKAPKTAHTQQNSPLQSQSANPRSGAQYLCRR